MKLRTARLAKQIGARIRARRESLGMKLTETATRAGTGKGALSSIETGRNTPGAAIVISLARVLGVSCDWLLTGDVNWPLAVTDFKP